MGRDCCLAPTTESPDADSLVSTTKTVPSIRSGKPSKMPPKPPNRHAGGLTQGQKHEHASKFKSNKGITSETRDCCLAPTTESPDADSLVSTTKTVPSIRSGKPSKMPPKPPNRH